MHDIWSMMKPIYDELVRNPPKDKQVCTCIKDVSYNDVLENLKLISESSLLTGNPNTDYNNEEILNHNDVYEWWNGNKQNLLKFHSAEGQADSYSSAIFI